jgi:general secretion pathway protein F
MQFQVKAIRGASEVALIPIDARSEDEAYLSVQNKVYDVISVRRAVSLSIFSPSKRASFPLLQFSQELIALLKAGLNVVEAIAVLHRNQQQPSHKALLDELLSKLREGVMFSAALGAFPEAFPPFYVATVSASERTGTIRDALTRYVEYQGEVQKLRSKVISASIYPLVLTIVGTFVALFLLGFVVPRFSRIYEGIGDKLPAFSKGLMTAGQLIDQNGAVVSGVVLGLIVLAYLVLSHSEVRTRLLGFLWVIPHLGAKRRLYELAQFYRTLSMLLRSGMPVIAALDMAGRLLSPGLRTALSKAIRQVEEGVPVSEALSRHGLTTTVANSMMAVAERSGNLGEMLDVVAAFHEEELARWVDWFTRLFEPILMAVIGVLIGLVVVFMYMPIFELAETIQ